MKVASTVSAQTREALVQAFMATYSPFTYYATLPTTERTALRDALLGDLAAGTDTAAPLLQAARARYVPTRPDRADAREAHEAGVAALLAAFPELRALTHGRAPLTTELL